MQHPVVWSPVAEDKYLAFLRFWTNTSLKKAVKFHDAVEALVENLGQFKAFCPASQHKPTFRKCTVIGGYSLIYKVKNDVVYIADFLDNRRRPKY